MTNHTLRHALLALSLLPVGKASALTTSKTETITYADNTTKWVIGQTASVSCTASVPASTACDGDVMSATTYDTTYALPVTNSSFGKLQSTMGYDTTSAVTTGQRGTLKTVTDGNGNTTTLTQWKRGIPQLVAYPTTPTFAATFKSAVVDDNGWVTSVTDENNFVTGYSYDAMGRLATVIYPTGDTIAWTNTTLSFVQVAAVEYGLPAGHWRKTVQTGNGKVTSYYNAYWQPVLVLTEDTGNVATKSFTVNRYDALGRKIFTSYAVGSLTSVNDILTGVTTDYDPLGRVISVAQDSELGLLTTTTTYNTGFTTTVTNPRSQVTTTSYLTYDQPSTDAPVTIALPEGVTTTIVRDPHGKPLTVTRTGPGG